MQTSTTAAAAEIVFNPDRFAADHRRNNRALRSAVRSGDKDKLLLAARRAVSDWNSPDSCWPDDWAEWQRALDDAFGIGVHIIEDL